MKTAEDFLHTKGIPSDTTIGIEGDILLTDLLQSYASQPSHVMSAEQVEGCCSLELCSSKKRLSVQCIKPNDCQFPAHSPSVKADGWVLELLQQMLEKEQVAYMQSENSLEADTRLYNEDALKAVINMINNSQPCPTKRKQQ